MRVTKNSFEENFFLCIKMFVAGAEMSGNARGSAACGTRKKTSQRHFQDYEGGF